MELNTAESGACNAWLNDGVILAYLYRKGMTGAVDADLIADVRWNLLGQAIMNALKEYDDAPMDLKAYADQLLSLTPDQARELPGSEPLVAVTRRAFALLAQKLEA